MRIVHVTPGYWPRLGGAELHARKVSEGLARRGHQVTVLTVKAHEGAEASIPPGPDVLNAVRIIRFAENRIVERILRLRGGYRLLRAVMPQHVFRMLARGPLSARLVAALLRAKADIVGVFGWWDSLLPFEVSLVRRIRPWRVVGIPMFHTEEAWSREAAYGPLLSACDAIVTNTHYERRFVEERLSRKVQVVVAGVGIEPDAYADRDGGRIRVLHRLGSAPVIGYVGRIVPSKGVTTLIEAMRMVWRENPEARLVLAGPRTLTGMDIRQVDAALATLSEAERARVLLPGEFDERDKASIFDSFDVFAMPSTGESFGIAYLEAWMCRKPVIGANVGSTPSVIRHGVDGILVDPRDPDTLGQVILKLLADPSERERLGRAGFAKTVSEFTWDGVVDRIEALYKELRASEHFA